MRRLGLLSQNRAEALFWGGQDFLSFFWVWQALENEVEKRWNVSCKGTFR
jgi:hypothetical protein